MSVQFIEVDQGNSTPIVFSDISGNLVTSTRLKIAEFGLMVEDSNNNPGSYNYLMLNGSVGVTNPSTTPISIRLLVYQRDVSTDLEIPIYTLDSTIPSKGPNFGDPNGRATVTFVADIGGINYSIPEAYYAFSLYVQFTPGNSTIPAPFINGPISFSGTSKIRNIVY